MIIDGHAHACGEYLTPDNIIRKLDSSGVDKVILVPGELDSKKTYSLPNIARLFPERNVVKIFNYVTKLVIKMTGAVNHIPQGNDYVFDLVTKSQKRVIQFIWITTQIENPSDYLNQCFSKWDFKGVKLHQCWEYYSVDSGFFRTVAEWAESHDLPLFIHLWSDSEVKKIIEYKKNHKNLKLIIAHLFGLEFFIQADCKDENLFFDTSTLQVTSSKRMKKAIDFYGADKITFGSDTPYGKNNLQKNIDRIRNLDIEEQEKEMILGGNIRRLLKL